ncbi:MAG: hypothetical protein NC434_10030 [Ruminococcus sp.]|nr:hypothetical protein [Ruminococcus sp.]MCM1221000.1 hypothetical protein [Lachnospiraceae bacterium]MCM1235784.1 hypothetical protein [Ruminococcus flavefaciens]
MDGEKRQQGVFMAYEYKEILTESSRFSFLLDGYENFGWEFDDRLSDDRENRSPVSRQGRVLRLKRDRKIVNKVELTRLERNFEACVDEIDKLEKAKTSTATMYALILGIIGTAFMAGSVFAVTAQPPYYILCIILAIPGFLGWILPYFLYKKTVEKRTEKMAPLIEAKYDEIYEIWEKGNKLLR